MKQKYLVLGQGVSNSAAIKLLMATSREFDHEIDVNQSSAQTLTGLKQYSTIIKAPGVPWDISILQRAIELNIEIITEINFALELWTHDRPIVIGVTGTNGKSSFVKFLNDYLNYLGKKSDIAGNYGIPVSDILLMEVQLDFLIIELSSFQTEIKKNMNLDLALCLNISSSHMERYQSFEDYKEAKLNIKNLISKEGTFLSLPEIIDDEMPADFYLSGVVGKECYHYLNLILNNLNISTIGLPNFCRNFEKLPYRQELIYQSKNQMIINDSKSTNWESTYLLLKSFENKKKQVHLLIGGKSRSDDIELPQKLLKLILKMNIQLYVFGEVKDKILIIFNAYSLDVKIDELKNHIENLMNINGVVLFSPAFPSFDQFKSYADRGDYFSEECLKLLDAEC